MKLLSALSITITFFAIPSGELGAQNQVDPHFAAELSHELRKGYGNVVVSPHGIASSLAMLSAGARGETEAEMARVLRISGSQAAAHRAFGRSETDLNRGAMSFSTSLWVLPSDPILGTYSGLCGKIYKADLRQVDFAKSPETARREINQWVVNESAGMTDEFLQRGDLNPRTELVLVNVAHFKGGLAGGFTSTDGASMPFQLEGGRIREVPMLSQTGTFRYADLGDVQLIELPCSPDGQSMLIALPTDPNGLAALDRKLAADPNLMSKWRKSLQPATVDVKLPKFRVVFNYSLNRALREMGMKVAFTDAADFSGITGTQGISVTHVLHRAIVELGDNGPAGSAKDALAGSAKGYVVPSAKSAAPAFTADRPFLYSIGDGSGSDTFIGRIGDPGLVGPPGIWTGGRTNPRVPLNPTFPELKSNP
jgi:serpin B